jgi:hypothetical protein
MMRHAPAALCLMTGLLVGVGAPAAEPAPSAARTGNTLTIPGGKPSGKIAGRLSRDQLRHCLAQQQSLKEQDAEAARAQAALQAQKDDIARERADIEQSGAALDAERAAVDATQAAAVEAFNAKLAQRRLRLEQHDAAIEAYNARLRPFNDQVQALNTTRANWVGDCGDRSYDEADYFAIQRGK